MTMNELLLKHKPYHFFLMTDRYGGSYAGGDWICFWGLCYPDEIFGGDLECMNVWEDIKKGYGSAGQKGRGWGVGDTPEEAVFAAARMAKLIE